MGDYKTIAAVSRAIAHVLELALDRRGMRGEYKVTIASPHQSSTDRSGQSKSINIFLYHVRPTPSLRNNDLPVYEGGRMVNVPSIGLDLYYLFSFYGSKPNDLESERLLGLAVTALNAHPLLVPADFVASADPNSVELGELDTVAVTPMTLTIEEMQRLWAMFPNVPYVLSMSYCASAALLVGDEIAAPQLPVASLGPTRKPAASPGPLITSLARADGAALPISFGSTLLITGRHLAASRVAVEIAGLRLPVPAAAISEDEVEVALVDTHLRAGQQPLVLLHLEPDDAPIEHARALAASAQLQLQLAPVLDSVRVAAITIESEATAQQPRKYRGRLKLELAPMIGVGQRVGVILNRRSVGDDAYAFPARLERGKLVVGFHGVIAGRYLVRVEVDGIRSLLEPQAGQPYTSPSVLIPPRKARHA